MYALPPGLEASAVQHLTGIGCPDCPGVLQVRVEGERGFLQFECRIGHVYSLDGLLAEKEKKTEDRLWTAVLSFEEMAAMLQDLEAHAARHGRSGAVSSYQERRGRVRAVASALRRLAEADRPVRLDPAGPR